MANHIIFLKHHIHVGSVPRGPEETRLGQMNRVLQWYPEVFRFHPVHDGSYLKYLRNGEMLQD